jgi:glycosyltransferase involved in cell wall biosynthesis
VKTFKKKNPLISIIIVTKNSENTIADTLASIKKQIFKNYEIIVIDKKSADNTIKIVKNKKLKSRIYIGTDKGVYDAINKGILKAKGSIISILHSDDFYHDKYTLLNVSKTFHNDNVDIVYGDLLYVKKTNKNFVIRYWKSSAFAKNLFIRGWSPPHPTFFCTKKTYVTGKLYKINIGNSSDIELMYRYLEIIGFQSKYLKKILVVMRYGGMSNNSIKKIISQNITILKFLKIHKNLFAILNFFAQKLINRFIQFLYARKYNGRKYSR